MVRPSSWSSFALEKVTSAVWKPAWLTAVAFAVSILICWAWAGADCWVLTEADCWAWAGADCWAWAGVDCWVWAGVDCWVWAGVDCWAWAGTDCWVWAGVDCCVSCGVDGVVVFWAEEIVGSIRSCSFFTILPSEALIQYSYSVPLARNSTS